VRLTALAAAMAYFLPLGVAALAPAPGGGLERLPGILAARSRDVDADERGGAGPGARLLRPTPAAEPGPVPGLSAPESRRRPAPAEPRRALRSTASTVDGSRGPPRA
jgi:hypothetical protein